MAELAEKNCVPCRGGVPPLKGEELAALAAQRRDLPARRLPHRSLRAPDQRRPRHAGRADRRRHRRGLAVDRGPAPRPRPRRPLGLLAGLRRAVRLRRRLSVPSRSRGLLPPHHDRHPRRPDLPVLFPLVSGRARMFPRLQGGTGRGEFFVRRLARFEGAAGACLHHLSGIGSRKGAGRAMVEWRSGVASGDDDAPSAL